MRITNKIMQNNNLANINTNKIYQDALSNQMSTQKKINRPSDDPVVAIRSLRLRSNVTEVTQYYDRNIPDAESWLSVTEDALKNLTGIVTNMIAQCTKGSNEDLTTSDRETILTALKALRDEVYSTGNADYAGRTLLSGYYTDKDVVFPANNEDAHYRISETLSVSDISKMTYITNKFEFDVANPQIQNASTMPADCEINRIRLAYDSLDYNATANMKLEYRKVATGYSSTKGADGTATISPEGYTIKTTSNEDGTKQVVVNGNQTFTIENWFEK